MAYETGTVTNSHQLIQKVYTFLKSAGWQDVSALRGSVDSDGYDFVLMSTGKYNDREIYIRIAAGLFDPTTVGDVQLPFNDGYTEFINGFAYQYFPENGAASDGIGQLGFYGPVLYYQQGGSSPEGANSYWDVDELNLWRFSGTGRPARRKVYDWTQSGWSANSDKPSWFDGRFYIYTCMSAGTLYWWRVNPYNNTFDYVQVPSMPLSNNGMTHTWPGYVKTSDNKEYVYFIMGDTYAHKTYYLCRYDIGANQMNQGFSNNCPYNIGVPGGSDRAPLYGFGPIVGTKRKRFASNGLPQHRLLYAAAGALQWDQSGGSTEWAYINAENGKWSSSIITPGLPWNVGYGDGAGWHTPAAVYAMKEVTGYAYDRLYVFRGAQANGFASIAINDDGYAIGSWYQHANTLYTQSYRGTTPFVIGRNLCLCPSYVWNQSYDRSLLIWQFPQGNPEQQGTWNLISSTFLDDGRGTDGANRIFAIHQHHVSRAHVTEFTTNTYWAFASEDRVVVVVKDSYGKYNYIYMGLFEPYSDTSVTKTVYDISSGETEIDVEDSSIFSVGNKYMIIDTTGQYQTITNYFGQTKKVAPAEMFRVIGIEGNTLIVAGLTYGYKSGSLVGSDPMPLMVRMQGAEFALTLNNINLTTPTNTFSDPCWQRYKMVPAVDNTFANATDIDERSQTVYLYGITLEDIGDSYTGKEVRGQLYNVYSCGTAVASEAEVAVGSETYLSFDIDVSGETQRIVVGPK